MADTKQLELIKSSVQEWNLWRYPPSPKSRELKLTGSYIGLSPYVERPAPDLRYADLREAELSGAYLDFADLRGANLHGAKLRGAYLAYADLAGADLGESYLGAAYLGGANLTDVDISGAELVGAVLIGTNLTRARLRNCHVYGISVWDLRGVPRDQSDLVITPYTESTVVVDDLEVAQFIYLLLKNDKIKYIIDTIGKKGVLILGRFTSERKAVLDAIRNKLRELGFVPIMFDFEKPTQRDFTETVRTLAGLSRFIIADITNPKSAPLELQATIPDYMIPFVPIIQKDEKPFSMFIDLKNKYSEWVLDVLEYDSTDNLITHLESAIVRPAIEMADQVLLKKAEPIRIRYVSDYK